MKVYIYFVLFLCSVDLAGQHSNKNHWLGHYDQMQSHGVRIQDQDELLDLFTTMQFTMAAIIAQAAVEHVRL